MPALPQPFSNQSAADWIANLQQAEAPDDRLRALQAIGSVATKEEVARWAAFSLKDADSTVKALAAKLLGNSTAPVPIETDGELISLLTDPDPDTRFESARALLRRKSNQQRRAVPLLLAFLDEDETQPLMVASIVNTLVEAGPTEGLTETELLPRLQRQLDNERAEVREAVSAAFVKWPRMCDSLTEALLQLLDDSEPIVRENIANAFGQAGVVSEQIRSALQIAGQDEDSEVARVAVQALERLNRA